MSDATSIYHQVRDREPEALADWTTVPEQAAVRLRVLIIEGNPESANSLGLFLELLGHEAHLACTGQDGVRGALEWPPDAVLCDTDLPDMSGCEVAEILSCVPATHGTRLIALSRCGRREVLQRASEAGFHHFLTKPAEPDALLRLLRTVG